MKNWPLPNFDVWEIDFPLDNVTTNWVSSKDEYRYKGEKYNNLDLPQGWGNPWPDLPSPDEEIVDVDLSSIRLSVPKNRCQTRSVLGYYLSWHIVGVSFKNENNREPNDGEELKRYNESLPLENRFGIHICTRTIDNYIENFSTAGLDPSQVQNYLEYCTYLTLIYVIAHEWGHYRSEMLSFQLGNLSESVTGNVNNSFKPSYLSYFINKKKYPDSNFEEIFAEWASLKLGIFNYYMETPAFAASIHNWPKIEAAVKFMLTKVIRNPLRSRPYSDIDQWIDFDNITDDLILRKFVQNNLTINRTVNDNVYLKEVRSLLNGKIIDLLVHNQMQFSRLHQYTGLVRSSPNLHPAKPDSIYYHFGYDDCVDAHNAAKSESYLRLSIPSLPYNFSLTQKVLSDLKNKKNGLAFLPIKVFPDILPLDPVYFH